MRARFIILAALAIMFSACNEAVESSITITEGSSDLVFTYEAAESYITFNATQDWTASLVDSGASSWLSIAPSKGKAGTNFVSVEVKENGPDASRSGKVQIACGTATQVINITQKEKDALVLTSEWIEMGKEGGQTVIEVAANVTFTAKLQEGISWVKLGSISTKAMVSSTVSVTVDPNTRNDSRQAQIYITGEKGLSATVTIQQLGGKSKEFNEEDIVASFGAISDTHIDGVATDPGKKLTSAFSQLQALALKNDPNGIDGILVAGDLIDHGNSSSWSEIDSWKTIFETAFSPSNVALAYTLGNHDVTGWWTSRMVSDGKNFRNRLGSEYYKFDKDTASGESLECRHVVVNGYSILTVTPVGNTPCIYDAQALVWLDAKLKEITEAEPDKYVMLLTHPMIHNTVYGSTLVSAGNLKTDSTASYWYTDALTPILKKYPQVVTFGGHLHFPLNDPRSIWQGDFTSFGCGSTRYMAFEGGAYYVNKAGNTTFTDNAQFSQGWLIQLDASGNLRATRMDFYRNATIGDRWEIEYPDPETKAHLARYNHTALSAANTAPVMSTIDVSQVQSGSTSANCTVKFAAASDDEFAHHYEVTLTSDLTGTATAWIMSDFYLRDKAADMKKSYEHSLGTLSQGKYVVDVVAVDSWGARSNKLSKAFTVGEGSGTGGGTTSELPAAYVDFDFSGGTIKDVKDNVKVTNCGATVTGGSYAFGSKNYSASALCTGTSKYVLCEFKNLTTSADMTTFMKKGFSVEAFYLDAAGSSAIQGIVCGTEFGGWGLAERVSRVPYFIAGEDKYNSYKATDASKAVTLGTLTHIVATYDPATSRMYIYQDGALCSSTAISGVFYPGANECFNRFCLGADVAAGENTVHYPSVDMKIVDANIYDCALSAAQVQTAFANAKKLIGAQ